MVLQGNVARSDARANPEAGTIVIAGAEAGRLDRALHPEADTVVVARAEAAGLDRALHLQAGRRRRRGLHRLLPDFAAEFLSVNTSRYCSDRAISTATKASLIFRRFGDAHVPRL